MDNTEILAINNKHLLKSDFIEFENSTIRKRGKVFFWIVIICSGIIYALAIISTISNSSLVLITVCLIITLLLYILYPSWLGGVRYRQYCMTHNRATRIVFFADRVETMVGDETIQTLYFKDLKHIFMTKNLYIMLFQNHVYGILRKDGFSQGDFETVEAQMQNLSIEKL